MVSVGEVECDARTTELLIPLKASASLRWNSAIQIGRATCRLDVNPDAVINTPKGRTRHRRCHLWGFFPSFGEILTSLKKQKICGLNIQHVLLPCSIRGLVKQLTKFANT